MGRLAGSKSGWLKLGVRQMNNVCEKLRKTMQGVWQKKSVKGLGTLIKEDFCSPIDAVAIHNRSQSFANG